MLQELFTRVFQAPPYIPACWIKEGERSLTWQWADWSLVLPICPWHQNLTVRNWVCVLISDCHIVIFVWTLVCSLYDPITVMLCPFNCYIWCVVGCTCHSVVSCFDFIVVLLCCIYWSIILQFILLFPLSVHYTVSLPLCFWIPDLLLHLLFILPIFLCISPFTM